MPSRDRVAIYFLWVALVVRAAQGQPSEMSRLCVNVSCKDLLRIFNVQSGSQSTSEWRSKDEMAAMNDVGGCAVFFMHPPRICESRRVSDNGGADEELDYRVAAGRGEGSA